MSEPMNQRAVEATQLALQAIEDVLSDLELDMAFLRKKLEPIERRYKLLSACRSDLRAVLDIQSQPVS